MSKIRKITIGTKEWADSNVNCYSGCSNNCAYCYAKKMAIRFNRKTEKTWKIMEPNQKAISKGYKKRKGRIMFPTSHDITNESLNICLKVLYKLLDAGNSVLITTKPHVDCIKKICQKFQGYKSLIQFRFTITSIDNELLKFWEPKAPSFEERLKALEFAYNQGFKTSVSIEPFLDKNPFLLVEKLSPYVTESIWIGKMNYLSKSHFKKTEMKYYESVQEINGIENLKTIVEESYKYVKSRINIKDSILNVIS